MHNRVLVDHYKCPDDFAAYDLCGELSAGKGFFRFGENITCYGQCTSGNPARYLTDAVQDVAECQHVGDSTARLPFDPGQIIDNLRLERYANHSNGNLFRYSTEQVVRNAYYGLRPLLPVGVRKHFQKFYLRGRQERPFPHWPVDASVESILEKILTITLKTRGINKLPFIWFWPCGASACAVMSHDVETVAGRDFCSHVMDIDDEYGVKASFQIVPETRYPVPEAFLETIRERGFEVNVQDLNHDGHLFSNEAEFLRRAKLINQYGKQYKALGFRSAVLYRKPEWFEALEFNYDMSIPNVAHMDPQPGGCCTLFPYWIGKMLEIPVTMTQDYTLFHILEQYSLTLWKTQINLVRQRHGLITFIIHPDYIIQGKAQQTYRGLLAYLADLRSAANIWIALPREVDDWWRARSQMRLVQDAGRWHIDGPQKERARLAYAQLEDGQITYLVESPSQSCAGAPQLSR